jgi:predicted aminopeptidase
MRRLKIKTKIILALVLLIAMLAIWNWPLLKYGVQQGAGQLAIVLKAKDVDEVLADPTTPDSIKQKLLLIGDVRRYAIDSLGLNDTDNYQTLFDQQGKEIMWVVTASEPFRLKEKRWRFPVIGSVPYKGFFVIDEAKKERQKLEDDGWDVSVSNPSGWSTLGWLTDPILSDMLDKSEGDLASLIIHEMVHATIFVKDSVSFNENLASFIGDLAALKFVVHKFGSGSKEHLTFIHEDSDFRKYNGHILRGANLLDSLYEAVNNKSVEEKKAAKKEAMEKIVRSMDTLHLHFNPQPSKRFQKKLPNNAYFLSFRRYQSQQVDLSTMFREKFNSDFTTMVYYYKERYPFL